ncbi:hypothetical protein LX36DRAFT_393699 [Colletotrichum falcatum]|nr:hypothetical protein LX36DRAFT_393699 [Colletotrichum falcatum]
MSASPEITRGHPLETMPRGWWMVLMVLWSLCRLSSATGQMSRGWTEEMTCRLCLSLPAHPPPTPSLLPAFLLGGNILVASGGREEECIIPGRRASKTSITQQASCVIQCYVMNHLPLDAGCLIDSFRIGGFRPRM